MILRHALLQVWRRASGRCPALQLVSERRVGIFDPHVYVLAYEMKVSVAYERTGQESRFGQDLKAVADAKDEAASCGELLDRSHDGRKACERPGPQVIAVREAARNNHSIVATEV